MKEKKDVSLRLGESVICFSTKGLYPEYIKKKLQISNKKTRCLQKWAKALNRDLIKEDLLWPINT